MGRKPKYQTPEQKVEAQRMYSKKYYSKNCTKIMDKYYETKPKPTDVDWEDKFNRLQQKALKEIEYLIDQLKQCGCKRK